MQNRLQDLYADIAKAARVLHDRVSVDILPKFEPYVWDFHN